MSESTLSRNFSRPAFAWRIRIGPSKSKGVVTTATVRAAIFHCTADQLVAKAVHSDKFVAAMRALGRRVEYVEVPGRGHCDLDDAARARYAAFAADFIPQRGAPIR